MKNPLRKRYLRELKSDFGKYLVIALFMIMLIGLVSGYLVAAGSIEKTFYEGWDKYNIEDGHITFSKVPEQEVLDQLEEKAGLTFYDLEYLEEDIDTEGTTLRIFRNREVIDGACLMEGEMPVAEGEIAIDRIFANNNQLNIGDTITLNQKQITISGIVALVDFNCLYEKNTDMMFNGINFGVGVMSAEGYKALGSDHIFANYAWKYNDEILDEVDENNKSEAFLDVLEDVIKEYDRQLIQAEVDELYAQANSLSEELTEEFEKASEEIEEKMTEAGESVATKAVESLTQEDKMALFLQGAQPEEYFAYALNKQNTTAEALVAKELGTTLEALEDFQKAAENLEAEMDSMGVSAEAPRVSLEEDTTYENEMDFSLDAIRNVVAKLEATGLYDVAKMNEILGDLEELTTYEFDENKLLQVDNYIPRYQNKAITYCMDDMSSDKPMFIVFDYIVVAILAFVFAVTISSTIQKEAGVIGTLRASGYSKFEMIRHYLFLPVLVSTLASVIGNILGYTVFVEMMKGIFYNSFSLASYESVFNPEAFLDTTVIPMVLMIVVNLVALIDKLNLSPIRFLRRDLAKKKKRRAMLLNKKIPFLHRFRLRILLQNIPAYITLSFGIFFGGVIAIFGFMFGPLLEDYAELIIEEKICNYQYVLMEQEDTITAGAEKYSLGALDSTFEGYLKDEITIYGVEKNSSYIRKSIPEGKVLASEGIMKKFKLNIGDTLTLKDPYSDKTYDFIIAGDYNYSASLSVFMNREEYNQTFGEKEEYFTGYFSDVEITDIDAKDIATVITVKDLTKVSDQMMNSMGNFMSLFKYFGAIMLALLLYLMTKQVIEKNMQSIAMTKILGFKNGEIAGLYLIMTGIVVVVAMAITIPLTDVVLRWMFESFLYTEISGYIPYIVSNSCYVYMCLIAGGCFLLVSLFMLIKIGKIEKSEALKNVE